MTLLESAGLMRFRGLKEQLNYLTQRRRDAEAKTTQEFSVTTSDATMWFPEVVSQRLFAFNLCISAPPRLCVKWMQLSWR
jgi:hypothetical protein